jgi:DNA-binding response OmpR family regulator
MDSHDDILLIEDSHSQAIAIQLLLQRAGYRVRVAVSGLEGLQTATDRPPRLVVLDIDLPGMNGFQVLARLKRSRATSHIPVVMLTHREHIGDVTRAIDLRADDYLFKEDAQLQLVGVVGQLLERETPMPAEK